MSGYWIKGMSFVMPAHTISWSEEKRQFWLATLAIRILRQDKWHRSVEVYKEAHCSDTIADATVQTPARRFLSIVTFRMMLEQARQKHSPVMNPCMQNKCSASINNTSLKEYVRRQRMRSVSPPLGPQLFFSFSFSWNIPSCKRDLFLFADMGHRTNLRDGNTESL